MKKFYSLFFALFIVICASSQTITVYESYVVLNIKNTGNTYYTLNGTSTNPYFDGYNLGTFGNTQSLVVVGGENNVLKCGGGYSNGGSFYYRVYPTSGTPNSFTEITPLSWVANSDGACGANTNEKWNVLSGTTNILTGLGDGSYTLEVYSLSTGSNDAYSSNFGSNYKASFTINNALSVNDVAKLGKSVFANGKLYTAKTGTLNLTIYDFSGKIVKNLSKNVNNGSEIDVNDLQKGLYFLKITDSNSSEIIKFSK